MDTRVPTRPFTLLLVAALVACSGKNASDDGPQVPADADTDTDADADTDTDTDADTDTEVTDTGVSDTDPLDTGASETGSADTALEDTAPEDDTAPADDTGEGDTGGVDTGPAHTGDTGEPYVPPHDGAYAGTITVHANSALANDSCTGPLTLTVDEAASPQISGSGTCTGGVLLGTMNITVTGELPSPPAAAGSLSMTVSGTATNPSWTGSFAADTLSGTFSGSAGVTTTYTGNFTVAR